MTGLIAYEVERRVATVTLNRPEKLNAISPELQADLIATIGEAEADDRVRVVVIRGAGRSFSVGYDVVARPAPGAPSAGAGSPVYQDQQRLRDFTDGWLRIRDARIPVIAQVHGHCIAGGSQLAVSCDITIVAENAVIGAPQLPLGAGFVSSFWAWQVGARKAKEIFFPVGTLISGTEAANIGLVNFAVPAAELEERTREYAHRAAKTPKEVLVLQKQAINRTQDVQGFRVAMMQSVEFDAIAHTTEGVRQTNRRIQEMGLKAALSAWNAED